MKLDTTHDMYLPDRRAAPVPKPSAEQPEAPAVRQRRARRREIDVLKQRIMVAEATAKNLTRVVEQLRQEVALLNQRVEGVLLSQWGHGEQHKDSR